MMRITIFAAIVIAAIYLGTCVEEVKGSPAPRRGFRIPKFRVVNGGGYRSSSGGGEEPFMPWWAFMLICFGAVLGLACICVVCPTLCCICFSSSDKVEHWVNEDAKTDGIIGYSMVANKHSKYSVARYGKCPGTWTVSTFGAQMVTSMVQEANFTAVPRHIVYLGSELHCEFSKQSVRWFYQKPGRLIVITNELFTDGSGRPNIHSVQHFKRFPGSLRDMEAILTQTFYTRSGEPGNFSEKEFERLKDFH